MIEILETLLSQQFLLALRYCCKFVFVVYWLESMKSEVVVLFPMKLLSAFAVLLIEWSFLSVHDSASQVYEALQQHAIKRQLHN